MSGVGILAFLSLLLISPVGFFFMIPLGQTWCEFRNAGEFGRHQARYEAVVKAIAAKSVPPGRPVTFLISPDKNATTLKAIDFDHDSEMFDRSNETNLIQASVESGGRLTVRICTYSMGHAGVYGLYYSSGPPGKGEVENSFGMGGRIAPVAPNWWSVSDYSQ